ncbi:MAG: DUF1553 domain-containing protein [Planctomycetes bacterium]|nr:DUF1553 domain-containing protein [Planctomycetota bacterium]
MRPRDLPSLVLALSGDALPDFQREVRPLLADRCFACHGPDEEARKRGLRLDTFDGATATLKSGRRAIVPGDLAASEMARRLTTDDDRRAMPPETLHRPLSTHERDTLLRWIESGAKYETHWAFVPPQRAPLPDVRDAAWCRDPLDRFVLAPLEADGIAPAPESDRATWLRRASFALNGLPPTPEETAAFLADPLSGAHERQLDRLFASPRYGERMAADWLDVARYADTFGYQSDGECRTWPWRDWLIGAFERDLPWDQFLREQLAGDLLQNATREQQIATAFNRLHRQTNEGGSIDEEFRQEAIADRVATFGTAFLGLTVECARCHDHKYDPIAQSDFHRLGAFFGAIDEAGSYPYATGALPPPTLRLPTPEQETELARRGENVAAAETALGEAHAAATTHLEEWLASGATPVVPTTVMPTPVMPTPTLKEGLDGGAPGPSGSATALDGDHGPTFGAPPFRRCDPLTVRLLVHCPDAKVRAAVLHTSHFTIESDPQGFELLIEDGHLAWRVVHVWPGSAAAIRTVEPLPLGRFVEVVASYDGSSRAVGMRLWFDGAPVATEIVRDHLDGVAATRTLQVGWRDRDVGLKGGAADELSLFDCVLTEVEVAELHAPGALAATVTAARAVSADGAARALLAEWFAAREPVVQAAAERLRTARGAWQELHDALPELMVMEATPHPRPAFVLTRGRYDDPDRSRPVAPDGAIAALLPFDPVWTHDRRGLADWCTDRRNPLVARVAVNRLFAQCFGRGLVETQENFGMQGDPPSHPQLLDWLAVDFVESGWRVQALLRRLLLSATFRQQSSVPASARRDDPRNRRLARGPALRLSAEMVRDQALHAAGLLALRVGGPSVKPWQPPGLWEDAGATGSYAPDVGDDAHRSSLYTFRKRTAPPPNLLLFDAGSREQCLVRRGATNTPLQALVLWNDPVFVETAQALARRVTAEVSAEVSSEHENGHTALARLRLTQAFRRLAGRAPADAELGALEALWQRERVRYQADPAAARAVAGDAVAPAAPGVAAATETAPEVAARAELAALTLCCQTLLASDAVVMVR